jgi:hypothetical protein
MLRIGMVGPCLLVVFAMSMVTTCSASAKTAERGVCKTAAKGAGVYENPTCTIAHAKAGPKKEFVWVPQPEKTPIAYTSKTGLATLKAFIGGVELPPVECTSSTAKGKRGRTESTSIVEFKGCTSAGEKCTGGKGAKAGEIITYELEGELGVINEAKGEVGEVIIGKASNPEGLSVEFKCGATEIKTKGSVIGKVTPVNEKALAKSTLTFAAAGETQIPDEFEGGAKDTLETEVNKLFNGEFLATSVEIMTAELNGKVNETRLF